jgi:hypothetical protein
VNRWTAWQCEQGFARLALQLIDTSQGCFQHRETVAEKPAQVMQFRIRCRCFLILDGDDLEDERSCDPRRIPLGDRRVTRTVWRAMCAGLGVAKGGGSVDEFDAAELGFDFPDAIHHTTLEAFDDGRSRGVSFVEPGERAAKMSKLIESGR